MIRIIRIFFDFLFRWAFSQSGESIVVEVEKLVGKEFRGWLLTRKIGCGADGVVYAGRKEGIERAIKIFLPESLEKNGLTAARERLELQLSLIGKKHHRNLVEVFEGDEVAELGTFFLVMELVPGTSLDKLIGKVHSSAVVPLARQLVSVAEYLESLELFHRDIKPANIIISEDFQKLTLLDLGIAHQIPEDGGEDRLSGAEFVATLRYSPPEFVWRKEDAHAEGAWRAVTFYQIGATLHDMIMGKPLFAGHDTPRARLYDAVRDTTPNVQSSEIDGWLIQTVQACLLKDWRQRLQFVTWQSFYEPAQIPDVQQQEMRIRLRQLRNKEVRQVEEAKQIYNVPSPSRERQLWYLNNTLILEIRKYVSDNQIFPRCSIEESPGSKGYTTNLRFDANADPECGFPSGIVFTISLGIDDMLPEATKLSFEASEGGRAFSSATWSENFNVETAFATCQKSFLDAIESMMSA